METIRAKVIERHEAFRNIPLFTNYEDVLNYVANDDELDAMVALPAKEVPEGVEVRKPTGTQTYMISDYSPTTYVGGRIGITGDRVLAIADGYRLAFLDPNKPVVIDTRWFTGPSGWFDEY